MVVSSNHDNPDAKAQLITDKYAFFLVLFNLMAKVRRRLGSHQKYQSFQDFTTGEQEYHRNVYLSCGRDF
jgi:hypothetical protein